MDRGTPARVVFVDDFEPLRRILTVELEARGCEVVAEAANGQEALDALLRVEADVVIIDFSMPVMNGLAATAAIHDRFPDVEIVAFTADPTVAQAMLDAGASRHFAKPSCRELLDYVAGR